jgi:hypothetical protein
MEPKVALVQSEPIDPVISTVGEPVASMPEVVNIQEQFTALQDKLQQEVCSWQSYKIIRTYHK